ncbi:hypothetical protein EIP86_005079 [Pleurotus ostreatoroseus]|nr:hypothetical protein EIP86_005079 [Pleurotus ostreatoroseus]
MHNSDAAQFASNQPAVHFAAAAPQDVRTVHDRITSVTPPSHGRTRLSTPSTHSELPVARDRPTNANSLLVTPPRRPAASCELLPPVEIRVIAVDAIGEFSLILSEVAVRAIAEQRDIAVRVRAGL